MKVSDEIWNLVNFRDPARGFLATTDKKGRCDVGCFSSLQFSDAETMTMLVGDNRTLANLKEVPRAALVVTRGEGMENLEGCRVYLKVSRMVEEGPVIEKGKQLFSESVGGGVPDMIKAFITFEVEDVRPLVDMGLDE